MQQQLARSTDFLAERCENGLGALSDRLAVAESQWEDFSGRVPPEFVQLSFAKTAKLREMLWILDSVRDKVFKRATTTTQHLENERGNEPPKKGAK